ncbi:MAG: type II toxin-antitoxin system RelE/ParE family toxin [Acetobacteraceae bacterium]
MNVLWTPEAEADRAAIVAFIRAENPLAATRMEQRFNRTAGLLIDHPALGRPGKIAGTRELIPHRSYRLIYEIYEGAVWVLAIVHSARQWPPISEQNR